jgi:hypothetical protein
MHLGLFFGVLMVIIVLPAGSAWAIPAPMSPEELFAASDLVALVRVLSVTCVAIVHHGREDLRRYTAELGLLRVRKGNDRRYDVVTVQWEEIPRELLGPWCVPYYAGGKGWTHLQGQDGFYETTWWNGANNWRHPGKQKLPKKLMQTRRSLFVIRMPFLIVRGVRSLRSVIFGADAAKT